MTGVASQSFLRVCPTALSGDTGACARLFPSKLVAAFCAAEKWANVVARWIAFARDNGWQANRRANGNMPLLTVLVASAVSGCGANERGGDATRSSATATNTSTSRPADPVSRRSDMLTSEAYREKFEALQSLLSMPPLQRPDVVILPAKSDPALVLSADGDSVIGPAPDDHYLRMSGHGGPEPLMLYTFGRRNSGVIISGKCELFYEDGGNTLVYEIISARPGPAASALARYGTRSLARSEYDLSGLVAYFDARRLARPHPERLRTTVVDARDEHIAKWKLHAALQEARSQARSREMGFKIGGSKS